MLAVTIFAMPVITAKRGLDKQISISHNHRLLGQFPDFIGKKSLTIPCLMRVSFHR